LEEVLVSHHKKLASEPKTPAAGPKTPALSPCYCSWTDVLLRFSLNSKLVNCKLSFPWLGLEVLPWRNGEA